jgi:hypothetical protein
MFNTKIPEFSSRKDRVIPFTNLFTEGGKLYKNYQPEPGCR